MLYLTTNNEVCCGDRLDFLRELTAQEIKSWEKYQSLTPSTEQIIKVLTQAIQNHLDSFAKTRNYDSVDSMAKYVGCSIPQFAVEAEYIRDAVAHTWKRAYEIMDEVLAGKRAVPTAQELIDLLPELQWPNV